MWITLLFQWECRDGYTTYSGRGRITIRNADTPLEAKQKMLEMVRKSHPDASEIIVYNIRETNKWSEIED
jgi:tRNA(Phe) wybutosine-synthesizing methylase Tyw3